MKLRKTYQSRDATPVTTRQLESLIRLAEARARVEMRVMVTADDAQDVIEIFEGALCVFVCVRACVRVVVVAGRRDLIDQLTLVLHFRRVQSRCLTRAWMSLARSTLAVPLGRADRSGVRFALSAGQTETVGDLCVAPHLVAHPPVDEVLLFLIGAGQGLHRTPAQRGRARVQRLVFADRLVSHRRRSRDSQPRPFAWQG